MLKIIFLSGCLILVVLGIDYFWPFVAPLLRVNRSEKQSLIQSFQISPQTISQKVKEGVEDTVVKAENNIASYFMEKSGKEIVGVIESLPSGQQEVIHKEYCGE